VRAQDRNAYQELFRLRHVEKTYEAIAGAPETSPLNLTFPLVHRSQLIEDTQFFRMREVVNSIDNADNPIHPGPSSDSFNSETWMDCIERFSASDAEKPFSQTPAQAFAKYLLKPLTGQRHQLRVHMNALGLPLIGDQFYPTVKRSANKADDFKSPLQLLAKTISFKDPLTGVARSFESRQQLVLPA
jgi:tRNA pseudouridine32 synthase/23S rRNA pseudouridine746 synthase